MERLTERTEHGYRLTPEQLPAAAERLGRWEDLALQLEASIRKAEEELAELKAKGKGRSVRFQQQLAQKLTWDAAAGFDGPVFRRGRRTRGLKKPQHMLHQQADAGDAGPAAESEEKGLAAASDQLDDIGVQPDGCHGHDDEEFGQLLQRGKERGADAGHGAHRGDEGSQHKKEDEKGEDLFQAESAALLSAGLFRLTGAPESQHQGDGNDGQGAGELDDGGGFQHRAAGAVKRVQG